MARIAIFDSGVGGLSIHQELKREIPWAEYVFISDTEAYPYGEKEDLFLVPRVLEIAEGIVNQLNPDLLVIACNTASTVALPTLREQLSLPIIGVVPAIKPAAIKSVSKKIAVLGTPATIRRAYTKALVEEFASDCEVLLMASSKLVEQAERKLRGQSTDPCVLHQELKAICEFEGCDVLVLACTHFPLLRDEISAVLANSLATRCIEIIDSGEAIARRALSLVQGLESKANTCSGSWTTQSIDHHPNLISEFLRRDLQYQGVLEI